MDRDAHSVPLLFCFLTAARRLRRFCAATICLAAIVLPFGIRAAVIGATSSVIRL